MTTPPASPDGWYDLFVSYSTLDDQGQWVARLLATIADLHRVNSAEDLTCFYAPDRIQAGQDWETQLIKSIPVSRLFLACLSPEYFASEWCRREWQLYIEQEPHRGLSAADSGGILPIYFLTVPGMDKKDVPGVLPQWVQDLLRRDRKSVV